MVRLERILWERMLNVRALGRQRVIKAPVKWNYESPAEVSRYMALNLFERGVTSAFWSFIEPLIAWMIYRYPRDLLLQQGLSWDDGHLHSDRELRRCVFFEHVARTGLHPYQWLLPKRRRARYYKVERGVRGFYAQDFVRKEAEQTTVAHFMERKIKWDEYLYKEFYSDMTPMTYSGKGKYILLEWFNMYGILRGEGWERYFYNEKCYDQLTEEETRSVELRKHFDILTPNGRVLFERYVNRFMSLYPGALVPEGQEFNFQEFYASYAVEHGLDTSSYDQTMVEKMRKALVEKKKLDAMPAGEKASGKSIVGTVFPREMQPKAGKGFMSA